jgi:hypothetical protein
MEILAARIRRQLLLDTGKWGHCAIYENELQRIWPLNEEIEKQRSRYLLRNTDSSCPTISWACVPFSRD